MKCSTQDAVASVFLIVALSAPTLAAAQEGPPDLPTVAQAVRHDTSPPLRDLVPLVPQRAIADRQIRLRVPVDLADRFTPSPGREDPIRQTDDRPIPEASVTPETSTDIEGLSDDDNFDQLGFRVVPPDTEGDVGLNHYVQMVNLIFAVYDKSTGNIVSGGGPFPNNILWQGFGGICETNNDGDPIVLYDHLAGRWIFSQFAIGNRDGHQCIAVSQTGDPTGSYYRYDFLVSRRAVNDYPKLGVWPDGYYMTANEFGRRNFRGAIAVAFERDAMLEGMPARFAKAGPLNCGSECFFSLQPSHLEGPPPALGTPNTFLMAFDDQTWGTGGNPDGYRLWDFAVDWVNGVASFTSLGQVDTDEFDANMCNFSRNCIPQPSPGEGLDSLSQFTMYRAQYRSFGTHDSIVVNHTVDVGGDVAGIRWVELRDNHDGAGWVLHQTGTFAPDDGKHRWMGSIAMDGAGNIALGYSVSSISTNPAVRYVTREAGDDLGMLPGGEVELIAGTGSQTSSFNRWGDYSSMSVDPVDDCTFWYTQEYYQTTDSFNFKTRIGSFKLPSCGEPSANVSITPVSQTGSGAPGDTVAYTYTVSNTGNVDDTYNLAASSSPPWTVRVEDTLGTSIASIAITAGSSVDVVLEVDIPPSATDGQQASETLTATSQLDGTKSATATATTTAVVPTAGVSISPTSQTGSGAPGDTVAYTYTVSNTGNVDDTYNLAASSSPPWTVRVEDTLGTSIASIAITAGSSVDVMLEVDIPPSATDGQQDSETLTATSQLDGTKAASATATTTAVVPTAGVTVTSIDPDTMQAGGTSPVTITGSNFAAGASVTFENGAGPTPTASVNTVSVDGVTITATVTAKSGGPPRNRVWDVRVTNPDSSTEVCEGCFTVTP